MELSEFTSAVPNFGALSQPEQILHFMWYLHTYRKKDVIGQVMIRDCFKERHMDAPNTSKLFQRLLDRRPKVVLQTGKGIKLEARIRDDQNKKYGQHETTIAVSQLLRDLSGKISNEAERLFLSEAIKCCHAKAFRAAIIMAWNLAHDHLLHWIIADAQRLTGFNGKIVAKVGTKKGASIVIAKREDFEDLKESEVLDICNNAGLFASSNTKKLPGHAAHATEHGRTSVATLHRRAASRRHISALVTNVVLVLK